MTDTSRYFAAGWDFDEERARLWLMTSPTEFSPSRNASGSTERCTIPRSRTWRT
jgi:hypothetical protein